jgi:hypothetical protein
MSVEDRQPDPPLVAAIQTKPTGTDEPTAQAREQPEPEGTAARIKQALAAIPGILRSIARGLAGFPAGFRGATWDDRADKQITDDLSAFSKICSRPHVDMQGLEPRIEPLLKSQRDFLRSEAAIKAMANRVTWVLCICAIVVPAVVVGLTTTHSGDTVWSYIFTLFALVWVFGLLPARLLQMLTGRTQAGVIWLALVLWVYIAFAVLITTGHGSSQPDRTIFVAAVCAVTVLASVLAARVYVVAWNEIALFHAWAEQRLEAAVVSILLGVIQVIVEETGKDGPPALHVVRVLVGKTGKDDAPMPLQRSGRARALLAQAAWLVNEYLPRLIDGGGAYSADARSTARGAAAALLDLRSSVNLPGGRIPAGDLARLTATAKAWSTGSLADLPRKFWLIADPLESASRRPGLLLVVRKLLLGALPLILLIAITLLPVTMPAAVTAALAPFAVTWLLLAIASVLAPADVKMDLKTLFGIKA